MKVLFAGATFCEYRTLQRLVLIADEIAFMDRPSVTFNKWGTIGHASEIRQYDTKHSPVTFSAYMPPSGPVTELYSRYIEADLANPRFMTTFHEGLSRNLTFTRKFIQLEADYSTAKGNQIRDALIIDTALTQGNFSDPIDPTRMFQIATHEDRRQTLKTLLIEASIHVTNAMLVSERTALFPVTDDPYLARLLGLRSADSAYVGTTPRVTPTVGIAVAKAVIPDEILPKLKLSDLFEYRKSAKDAYKAWSVEIERLSAEVAAMDPASVESHLPRIIATQVAPRIVDYHNEMKTVRDKLFGDLIKKVAKWELPSISLAYLTNLDLPGALALFAAALGPVIPTLVDYFQGRRQIARKNSMAYLVGVTSSAD